MTNNNNSLGGKLYRSRDNRMLGGVCGGLGESFGIDPTIIRLVFGCLVIFGGAGVLLYALAWIVIPEQGGSSMAGDFIARQTEAKAARPSPDSDQDLNSRLYDDPTTGSKV